MDFLHKKYFDIDLLYIIAGVFVLLAGFMVIFVM